MADTSFYAEFAHAIPVAIGGIVAIAGGLAVHVFTDRSTAKREQEKLKRERLESLVKALYAHSQWLADQHKALLKNEPHDIPQPFDEVRMIQALHFPELENEIRAVQKADFELIKFNGDQRCARIEDEAALGEGV